ncbi:molybdopterin converting factor subunit 1 [Virgibacillus oceani]
MINVLFFAELQEAVGENKLSFDVENITVHELKSTWLEKYQVENLDKAMIAVNEEYVGEETVLQRGDVVAFIPPVSGG